ncbi:unnamed protein product [Symbiodinium pilosum]|uniref:JmjC domain-containing protein n=1 Tax=Symbiodinium pilosum TaxID=2952 RepID=A0A812T0Q8_SYMPI|nr:unnamed protein product [Symbiodinium pilosum]
MRLRDLECRGKGLSLLWFGVSPIGWWNSLHTDVQDNVLIELVSPTNVYVFPRELFLKTPPDVNITGEYHKIRLEPGQGVAIPSNFLHTVEHLEEFFLHLAMRSLWFASAGKLWDRLASCHRCRIQLEHVRAGTKLAWQCILVTSGPAS